MQSARFALAGIALASATLGATFVAAPAAAAIVNTQPGPFIESLSDEGLTALRGGDRAAARVKFRTLLAQHFAVDAIGDRLIRRWRPTITPAQYKAYKAAFPTFIIGTYADRLFDYASADVKVGRVVPAGTGAAVQTAVTRPGARPISAIWTVEKNGPGYRVTNLTVAGVNLAITQTADFDAIVQRRGFDGLVALLKSRG